MDEYTSISRTLLEDNSLSFVLGFHPMNAGVKNVRYGGIYESNPESGKLIGRNDCVEFREGKTRGKKGYSFQARNVNELLGLVERACSGETGIVNTVSTTSWAGIDTIDGLPNSEPGLDDWIYEGLAFGISQSEGNLVVKMSTNNFAVRNFLVSSTTVPDFDQAVRPYQNHPQKTENLKHIQSGAAMFGGILNKCRLVPNELMAEMARSYLPDKQHPIVNYDQALQQLEPFNITNQAKNALFFSISNLGLFRVANHSRP
jgi:hypothetical protein